jgi:hypothetical protein
MLLLISFADRFPVAWFWLAHRFRKQEEESDPSLAFSGFEYR